MLKKISQYREIYGSGASLMAYSYDKPMIASNILAFIEETDNVKTELLFENDITGLCQWQSR